MNNGPAAIGNKSEHKNMRKIRLSPVQQKILWMLEEAGRENLACIRATLKFPPGDLEIAIAGLKRLGFVVDDIEDSSPALSLTKSAASK
jgi:hypothetical protein